MSAQYRTRPSAFVRSPLRGSHFIPPAVDGLVALRASLKEWRNRWRTLRALDELDEHQLRDIGLTRDETSPGHPIGYRALAGLDEVRRHSP